MGELFGGARHIDPTMGESIWREIVPYGSTSTAVFAWVSGRLDQFCYDIVVEVYGSDPDNPTMLAAKAELDVAVAEVKSNVARTPQSSSMQLRAAEELFEKLETELSTAVKEADDCAAALAEAQAAAASRMHL